MLSTSVYAGQIVYCRLIMSMHVAYIINQFSSEMEASTLNC